MDEDNEDLFGRKEIRKRKDKKRHRHSSEKEESAKESMKKMREEIEELRIREVNRAKELDDLRKKIDDQEKNKSCRDVEPEYSLNFSRESYLSKGFIESAKWIKEEVAKKMVEQMSDDRFKSKFEIITISKKSSTHLGMRTCARYNRGEPCNQGKWHATHKVEALWTRHGRPNQQDEAHQGIVDHQGRRNDLRLHACTLCLEALGTLFGHSVLNCPWILQKNWTQ